MGTKTEVIVGLPPEMLEKRKVFTTEVKRCEENLEKVLALLKNFVKNEDHFYSEENQKYLQESIREFKEGKVVSFSDEEWEKFVNAQNI